MDAVNHITVFTEFHQFVVRAKLEQGHHVPEGLGRDGEVLP